MSDVLHRVRCLGVRYVDRQLFGRLKYRFDLSRWDHAAYCGGIDVKRKADFAAGCPELVEKQNEKSLDVVEVAGFFLCHGV